MRAGLAAKDGTGSPSLPPPRLRLHCLEAAEACKDPMWQLINKMENQMESEMETGGIYWDMNIYIYI